ncbi:MAG: hypothetical protein ACLFV8_12460 [Alphaproteobacteria bacterium]
MLTIEDTSHDLPINIYRWHVAFWHWQRRRHWLHRFARGRYKHVSALGYSARCGCWVLYEPGTDGTRIRLVQHDKSFLATLEAHRRFADLLALTVNPAQRYDHMPWRPGQYCVPAIIRLLGVKSGAVTPTGLYRDLVRMGATPSFEE